MYESTTEEMNAGTKKLIFEVGQTYRRLCNKETRTTFNKFKWVGMKEVISCFASTFERVKWGLDLSSLRNFKLGGETKNNGTLWGVWTIPEN